MRFARRQTGEVDISARTPEFEPLKGLRNPKSDSKEEVAITNDYEFYENMQM